MDAKRVIFTYVLTDTYFTWVLDGGGGGVGSRIRYAIKNVVPIVIR